MHWVVGVSISGGWEGIWSCRRRTCRRRWRLRLRL